MSSCSITRTKAPRSTRNRRNRGFSSSSAEPADDVLMHILSYLPVKTLLRFKRVSKRWLSIITNPDFTNRFIESNHPFPISGFIVNVQSGGIKYVFVSLNEINPRIPLPLPLRFVDHPTDMFIMQSTNGLLLCKCSCSNSQFDTNYYVYNPTTKQNTLLPQIAGDNIALSLAFDPSKSPYYKVICLRGSRTSASSGSNLYHIEVYSSNEGPWRRLFSVPSFALPPTSPTTMSLCHTFFWNDAVHWFDCTSGECISFDIAQEEIKFLPLPYFEYHDEEILPDIGSLRFLEESRGNLYSIEVNDMSSSTFPVYEMERGSSNWSLKYNVDLEPLATAFPEMVRTEHYADRRIYMFTILGFVKEEIDANSYILLHIPNKAVKYNFIDKTFKKLCDFKAYVNDGLGYEFQGFQKSFKHIESLANV